MQIGSGASGNDPASCSLAARRRLRYATTAGPVAAPEVCRAGAL